MDDQSTISVIIPCYRSSAWLPQVVERLGAVLSGKHEILLVNDASPDDTWAVIRELCDTHRNVRGINLLFNVGQFRATICGMEHALGDYILTMDDDLQQLPEEVPKLIRALRERPDVDCVIGSYSRKYHDALRNLGSRAIGKLNGWLYDKPSELQLTSFRLMNRITADAICRHRTVRPVVGALLLQSTRRIINVQVEHAPRPHGQSGWTLRRLASAFFDNVVLGSTAPLRLVTTTGLMCATISAVLGLYYVTDYFIGRVSAPGFAMLSLLTVFLGGATLFSIGLLGEYVGRIVRETTAPPRYVIRDRVGRTWDEP